MRIQFEIKEKLPELIEEILDSDKWQTSVKEEISGRTTVVIRDQAYGSEATIEIYACLLYTSSGPSSHIHAEEQCHEKRTHTICHLPIHALTGQRYTCLLYTYGSRNDFQVMRIISL